MGNWSQNIINKDWKKNYYNVTKKQTIMFKREHGWVMQYPVFPTGLTETSKVSHTENWHIFDLTELPAPHMEKNPYKTPTDQTRFAATS